MTEPSSYTLGDLLDVPKLQDLFDSLNDAFSFPSAVIDCNGDILTATAWQDVCTRFHRVHPESEAQCRESDRNLERHLDEADPAVVYHCPRGLVEAATPIIVGGEHLGNVFMGQLFLEAPDLGFFREQAARFGFDEAAYLDAVARVPILTREHLDRCLTVLRRFAETLGGMALEVIRQREASDAAAERAEFSRQVVAGAQEGIVVHGPDMAVLEWNPYMERLSGVAAGDVVGRVGTDVFPFMQAAGPIATFRAALAGEASGPREIPFVLPGKNGSGWVSDAMAPLRDADGRVIGVIETVRDITERKRADEDLRDALHRLQFHVENSPFAVMEFDQDVRITGWSGRAERMFGWSAGEVIGKPVWDVPWIHEDDAARVTTTVAEMTSGRRASTRITNRNYRKDGAVIVCEWYNSALIDPSGRLTSILALVLDVTERAQAEKSLRESEERLRRAQSIAQVGNWEIDLRERRMWASEEAFRLYGIERWTPWLPLEAAQASVVPEYRASLDEALRRLVEKGEEYDEEFAIERASDGEIRFVHSRAELVLGDDGGAVRVAGALQDITSLRAAEREAVDAAARLRKTVEGAVAAMGALVETRDPYTAGHERRVTQLAVALAVELGIDGEALETLSLAGEVHDIGKVAVPAEILTKPGRLTPTEFAIIKVHPVAGADILAPVDFGAPVADIVRWHHERLDGSGYPDGLTGDEIPLEARILAVADVVEAMASHRPYRPALGVEAALGEVRSGAGRLYDAEVTAACERVFAAGFAFSD